MATSAVRFGEQGRGWQAVQLAVLLATVAFIATVAFVPLPSIALFWNVVVPILPLSFLVTPILWRSVCPLATLNVLASRAAPTRRLASSVEPTNGFVAIALLLLLVPARHLGLNTSGGALAAFIAVAALVAVAAGSRYESRAGFCNLICPVVPVERLYGQQPLVRMASPRCASCAACTPRGCLDVARDKAVPQLLGRARRSDGWLLTAFGVFASAFPGFIVGYFRAPDVPVGEALSVYGPVFGWAIGSAVLVNAIVRVGRVPSRIALPALAGVAAAVYYTLAAPGIVRAIGAPEPATLALRVLTVTFVAAWTWRAVSRATTASDVASVAGERALPVVAD